jgi:hypothetical protein
MDIGALLHEKLYELPMAVEHSAIKVKVVA